MTSVGGGRRGRLVARLLAFVLLVVLANLAAGRVGGLLDVDIRPTNEDAVHRLVMTAAVAYALLIAIPFVPGVEIAFALIGMFGPAIVLLVYVSTLAGLSLAFLAGRLCAIGWLVMLLRELGLSRASRLLADMEPLDRDGRLAALVARAPHRLVPLLLRHRYLALAVAINLPGNIVIGGGGGIALVAGASGLFSTPAFLATIAIAVAPVPLAVLVFGKTVLGL